MDELQRLAARITAGWERLTRSQRIAVIAFCAAGAVGIFMLRHRSDAADWQPITTGREFSAKEISAIQTAWRRQGLTGSRRDGGMLNVPKAELAKYQAALPPAVIKDADSASEWDRQLSGVNAFTSSEQLEQRKDNALRNELRRVLRAIPAIAEADVIWARGKSRSAFSGRGKVTATVNITPKDGHDLTPELGQSLRSAVASSNASPKFSNRPIQDFLICKKRKLRQGNHRFNWQWKEFAPEQWPCRKVKNWQMHLLY